MRGREPDTSVGDERLKAEHERLRRQRISVLRRELKTTLERVQAIRRELRLLGDREVRVTMGATDWSEVYDRLGATFTAKQMGEMTGARPALVASIVHRWRTQGRIAATSRGQYRKVRLQKKERS
jgi:hypothetical protein